MTIKKFSHIRFFVHDSQFCCCHVFKRSISLTLWPLSPLLGLQPLSCKTRNAASFSDKPEASPLPLTLKLSSSWFYHALRTLLRGPSFQPPYPEWRYLLRSVSWRSCLGEIFIALSWSTWFYWMGMEKVEGLWILVRIRFVTVNTPTCKCKPPCKCRVTCVPCTSLCLCHDMC